MTVFTPPLPFIFNTGPVGRSIDQAMSAQYLLTPLPESCQIRYIWCPWGVNDLLHVRYVHSIFLYPFDGKMPNLVQRMPLESRWPLLMFSSVGIVKVQGQTLSNGCPLKYYLMNPLLECCQSWYSGYPLERDVPFWFSFHVIKCQGQTFVYSLSCNSLLDDYQTCYTGFILPIGFRVIRSRLNNSSSSQHCPLNILWTICLIITELGVMWGIYVSQIFLVLYDICQMLKPVRDSNSRSIDHKPTLRLIEPPSKTTRMMYNVGNKYEVRLFLL